MSRILIALLFGAVLASCGIKSDLQPPSGAIADEDETNLPQPPQPLGQ